MTFILVVDSNRGDTELHRAIIEAAEIDLLPIISHDLESASREFTTWKDQISAIIIDSSVAATGQDVGTDETRLTSGLLIEEMRQRGFLGLIVGTSVRQEHRITMLRHGCNCGLPKKEAAPYIINFLLSGTA